MSEHENTLICMEKCLSGEWKSDEPYYNSFEGGMYEVHGSCFIVVVDDHMYFFNF